MKKTPRIMVCVTRQKTCERLIQTGSFMAKETQADLSVVHVERPGVNFLGNPSESEALEYLFQVSSSFHADLTVLREDDVVDTLVRYVKKNGVVALVMGRPPVEESEDSIVRQLRNRLPDVNIMVI
ncbi:MAG: universal stress protein [Christensenellales bacterium]